MSVLRGYGHNVVASDVEDYGLFGSITQDFLTIRVPLAPTIITNPPFKIANEFVARALELCPTVIMCGSPSWNPSGARGSSRAAAMVEVGATVAPAMDGCKCHNRTVT